MLDADPKIFFETLAFLAFMTFTLVASGFFLGLKLYLFSWMSPLAATI